MRGKEEIKTSRYTIRLGTLLLILLTTSLVAQAEVPCPNVILVMVDDIGYSDIGCYGGEIQTPNLDALAQGGLRFRQFYNTGKCHSSRVTLLSGLHSYQAGNAGPDGTVKLHNGNIARGVSIAEVLREAGYYTAVSGKWHISPEPREMGFDRFFGFLPGYIRDYFASDSLQLDGQEYKGRKGYITDLITEYGIEFIEEAKTQKKPFFLYLPYNAPHYPLQAPQEEIDKYRGIYQEGWHAVRARRLEKMKSLGLVESDWIPADPKEVKQRNWNALSEDDQDYQDLLMATYAGMIDRLDQNIGKLVQRLEELGELENTLILFFTDNGAESGTMTRERELFERSHPTSQGDSFTTVGADWSFVSNTPYRFFKSTMHEGGIISPCIAHWPAGISLPGGTLDHQNVFHLMDLMPTVVELCGATYPESFEGRTVEPMNGISMAPAFAGKLAERENGIYQMFGINRAYRLGDWKIVSKGLSRWGLYHMKADPTEQNNLVAQHPEKVEVLKAQWWQVATEIDRLPPQLSKPNQDKPARYKRRMLQQGDQRMSKSDQKPKRREGKSQETVTKENPTVVAAKYDGQPVRPPSGADVLFDGSSFDRWKGKPREAGSDDGDLSPTWKLVDGKAMEIVPRTSSIQLKDSPITSGQLHIEWATPRKVAGTGQGRGNSGVMVRGLPELQVLDSWQNDTDANRQAGAFYNRLAPRVNASRPPGEWQSYDIYIQRPKLQDGTRTVESPGSVTVYHNGVLIHDAVEITSPFQEGDLWLQDHNNPGRFRNIWFLPGQDAP